MATHIKLRHSDKIGGNSRQSTRLQNKIRFGSRVLNRLDLNRFVNGLNGSGTVTV